MRNSIHRGCSAALLALVFASAMGCARGQTVDNPQPAVVANKGATDAAAKEGLKGFYQKLMFDELNALPIKRWIFAKDEAATLNAFSLQKFEGATAATEEIRVTGQPFEQARRITVAQKPQLFWHLNWTGADNVGAQKGDKLWGVIYYRVTDAPDGAGKLDTMISQETGGKWDNIYHIDLSATPSQEWRRHYFSLTAKVDGPLRWWTNVGGERQTIEIGGMALVNLGPNVGEGLLRKNELNLNYAGREPDAAWRKDARARIEKIRKGDFSVKVVDATGKPVANAAVKLEMKRHAFPFGTQVPTFEFRADKAQYRGPNFRATSLLDNQTGERYRRELDELFNFATFGPSWRVWDSDNLRPINAELGELLLKQNKTLKMHILLYPRTDQVPDRFKGANVDPDQFQREHLAYVREVMTHYKGKVKYWDVLNEPNSAVLAKDLYRPADRYYDFLARLYQTARQTDPSAKLYLNETAWESAQAGRPARAYLKTLIDQIRARGGQVDGVGAQLHVGAGMHPPVELLGVFDEVAKWNVELGVSEFDSKIDGPQTPEIQAYQADALRDTLTVAFSHPSVTHFIMWGFWDGDHWLNNAPLFNEDWTPKPALATWKNLLFKEWWTNAAGTSDAQGQYGARGFYGDYNVTVSKGGKTATVPAKLDASGQSVTVTLK